MSLRTALEQFAGGPRLTALPLITAAFGQGRLCYSKVRAITRIATLDTEQPLLDLALAGTASHVERVVRLTRQGQADPRAAVSRRRLRWHDDDHGILHLTASLPAEQGARLVNSIDNLVQGQERAAALERSAEH